MRGFAAPPTSGLWEAYQAKWPEFLLERGRAQEALLASQKLAAGHWPVGRTMGHILAGRAYVHLDQLDKADAELAAAEKEAALIEEVNPEPLLPHPRIYPVLGLNLLKTELALRRGQPEAEPSMRNILLKAKEGFRQADSTGSLFLLQFVSRSGCNPISRRKGSTPGSTRSALPAAPSGAQRSSTKSTPAR